MKISGRPSGRPKRYGLSAGEIVCTWLFTLFFLDVAWTSFLRMERCELLWGEMNYMVRIERL
ncbi:conserved domain protein [Prevotella denticola CRIS 18C-A]|uniref:Conserved domain protein n=1 Tax=Prevotella denticola CRIS 18C-A TaxID=944557 RepID=F0H9E0_9BACT|nr:conserved domain protein [Prevotella denticola CRIS 18C-A]